MAFERRYAGTKMERRGQRGPNDAVGVDPYRALLGPLGIAKWHSQLGIAQAGGAFADTWTDQWGGRVVQAPSGAQRPVYAADGSAFGGKPVVQTATAGTLYLTAAGLTPLALTGTRPYLLLRARLRTTGGSFPHMFDMGNGGGDLFQIFDFSAASFRHQFNNTVQVVDGAPPTTVKTIEAWADGVNLNISIDGSTTTAVSAAALTGDLTSVWFGNSANVGITCADSSHALAIVASAYPGSTISTSLRALAAAEFPP